MTIAPTFDGVIVVCVIHFILSLALVLFYYSTVLLFYISYNNCHFYLNMLFTSNLNKNNHLSIHQCGDVTYLLIHTYVSFSISTGRWPT